MRLASSFWRSEINIKKSKCNAKFDLRKFVLNVLFLRVIFLNKENQIYLLADYRGAGNSIAAGSRAGDHKGWSWGSLGFFSGLSCEWQWKMASIHLGRCCPSHLSFPFLPPLYISVCFVFFMNVTLYQREYVLVAWEM